MNTDKQRLGSSRKFVEGQRVRLRSGGPVMCVEMPESRQDGVVNVVWFDTAGIIHRDALHEDALHVVEDIANG